MKKNIYFIAPPFSGHLYPQIELAQLIRDRYNITFITGYSKIKVLEDLGFDTVIVLKHKPYAIDKIAQSDKSISNNPVKLYEQFKENMFLLKEIIDELDLYIKGNKPDLIIGDFVAPHGGIVADRYNIPWITTIPTPFAIENIDGTPAYAGGLIPKDGFVGRSRDFIMRNTIHLVKSSFAFLARGYIKEYIDNIYRKDGTEVIYSPHSILALGMKELEFDRTWPKPLKWLGPCSDSPEKDIDMKLPFSNYKYSVFITLGTHLEWAKEGLLDSIKPLITSMKDTLFVLSLGACEVKLDSQLGNLCIVDYLPYTKYLKEFDAIIHHGGAGISYNAIKGQIGSIVIPQDYDQFDYAARLEYFRLAYRAKSFKDKSIKEKLLDIFQGKFDNKLKDYKNYLDAYDKKAILISEIEKLIGDNNG